MAANNLMANNRVQNIQNSEETRSSEKYLKPAVNIIELEESLVLMADIPGAAKENVDVHLEKGILTISAPVTGELPGRPIYTEFELAPYYRQFEIPESLDQENATASFANGVLTLRLSKAAIAKPRRIEVKVAS